MRGACTPNQIAMPASPVGVSPPVWGETLFKGLIGTDSAESSGGGIITAWPELIWDALLGGIVVFSLCISYVAAMSYRRTRNPKILKITIAFCLFFIRGIALAVITLFTSLLDNMGNIAYILDAVILIEMIILIVLYLSIFRK